jgi:hypothetical protein
MFVDVSYWHVSDIQRCPLFGRDGVNSGRGADKPISTRMTISDIGSD